MGDLTDVRVPQAFVSLAVGMDVSTRSRRGGHLRRHLDQTLTWTALRRALRQHRPERHHSEQGVQYAATTELQTWRDVGARLRMAAVGEATAKGYAERLRRTITAEAVTLNAYADFQAADPQRGRFLDEGYQLKRIHSALGYLTPEEVETPWRHKPPNAMAVKFETP